MTRNDDAWMEQIFWSVNKNCLIKEVVWTVNANNAKNNTIYYDTKVINNSYWTICTHSQLYLNKLNLTMNITSIQINNIAVSSQTICF